MMNLEWNSRQVCGPLGPVVCGPEGAAGSFLYLPWGRQILLFGVFSTTLSFSRVFEKSSIRAKMAEG